MGVSQHTHGTDNARCLIALSLICGQVDRPGTGLHPLRGQNNVQGASDAGLIPMFFPDYKSVESPEMIAKYERAWGKKLDPKRAKPWSRSWTRCIARRSEHAIMGENPRCRTRLNHARGLSASLHRGAGHLLTETGSYADVILPPRLAGKGWHCHQYQSTGADGRKALPLPGDSRQDLWIIGI
jgi:formate dehydrogenase major subunit